MKSMMLSRGNEVAQSPQVMRSGDLCWALGPVLVVGLVVGVMQVVSGDCWGDSCVPTLNKYLSNMAKVVVL